MKVKNTSQRKIELHEPEIKWRSKGHKLVAKITQSSSWIRKTSCDLALEYNLSPEQCSMLRALYDNQGVPISTNQLRYLMLTPLSDTPKLVDKLLKKELIVKKANAHDKRLVAISITAKGIDILEKLQTKSVSFW